MIEAFVRQRRNLMITSGLVLFVNFSGAQLDKINLLGNSITLTNPEYLSLYLLLLLAYFLIRFFQVAHHIENKGIKERFTMKVGDYLKKRAVKSVLNNQHQKLKPGANEKNTHVYGGFNPFIVTKNRDHNGTITEGHQINISVNNGIDQQFQIDEIDKKYFFFPVILAIIYIIARTRLVTEYFVPPILGFIAVGSFVVLPGGT